MKKIFAFAIAAVTMTVGCQKIQELVNPDRNQPSFDDNEPVEITFNTNVVNVETKANGSVTTFDPAKHTLYVYGLNTTNSGVKEVSNIAATATDGSQAPVTLTLTGTHFYNGTTDIYDFYGYYVDDAADPTTVTSEYTLPVTINGNQDILLAKADKSADVLTKTYADGTPVNSADAYSAKTARAGVTPNLKFEHQMSQFSFSVRNCGTYKIELKGLALNTTNKGTLTVAGEYQGLVASTVETDKSDLEVSTTSTDLEKVEKSDTENYTEVGEPIMVFSENTYTAILYLWQEGMETTTVRRVTVPVIITNDQDDLTEAGITGNDPGALKGYAYDINITVYSLEQISVQASLTGWKDGKTFIFDTEDNTGDAESDVNWPVAGDDDDDELQEPDNTTTKFTISEETKTVDAAETTFTITVTPVASETVSVTIPTEITWISVTSEGNTHTFTVSANEDEQERDATITFTDDAAEPNTATLTVTQSGTTFAEPEN